MPPQALTYEEFYDNGPKAAEDDPVDDDDDARGGGAGRPFYVVYSEKIIRITTETDDSKNEPKKSEALLHTRVRANSSREHTDDGRRSSSPRHRTILVFYSGLFKTQRSA